MKWDLGVNEIQHRAHQIMEQYQGVVQNILKLPGEGRNFRSVFHELALADSVAAASSTECTLPSLVSESKEVRIASAAAKQKLNDMWVANYFNNDLYAVLKDTQSRINQQQEALTAQQKRLVNKLIQMFEINGMGLEESKREKLSDYKKSITALSEKFCTNINEDSSTIRITKDQLEGLEESFYSSLEDGDGYKIGCKRPQYLAVMQNAKSDGVRREMLVTADSRCKEENTKLLEEILSQRKEAANLLGFAAHADFELSTKMAKEPNKVISFLQMINSKLDEDFEKDYSILSDIKKELSPSDPKLRSWDTLYLKQIARERFLSINENEVKKYFPMDRVIPAILSIYSNILSITFKELTDVPVWHPTVKAYAVLDSATEEVLGYFYLDLFSRPGKYAHQCVFPITPSFSPGESMEHVKSACTILGNMTQPTPSSPSLLLYDEVRTFFHEFGHVMHCVLTSVDYSLFAWSWAIVPWKGGVEQDFLEVPSMMFEMWMKDPKVLKKICGHYLNPEQKLPDNILKSLAVSGSFLDSISSKMYIAMALYDMEIHLQDQKHGFKFDNQTALNLITLFFAMVQKIARNEPPPGTFKGASWYHPCMGYDAGYYGYLWSEVYASSLYEFFENSEKGVEDAEIGLKVREKVLKCGGSKDGWDMMVDFLGKEPNVDSYFRSLEKGNKMVEELIQLAQNKK
uniref:Peptidase M3A/M3B catalytic domain-containing protein n=1 Tax=Arcella intermedia TaxID=1963864 RepID=A0A6B2KZ71_9EUKA